MSMLRGVGVALLGLTLVAATLPASAQRPTAAERRAATTAKEAAPRVPDISKSGRINPKAQSSSTFGRAYQRAVKHYQDDEYDQTLAALAKLRSSKNTAYELSKIEQLTAYVHFNEDRIEEAVASFRAAIAADGLDNLEHFQAKLAMAEMLQMNDQFAESNEAYLDWLKDAETVEGRHYARIAKNYYDQDDYESALRYIDLAYATGDEPERAWSQMKANMLLNLERSDEAIVFARGVLAQSPDDLEFVNFLTGLLVEAERAQEAVDMLSQLRAEGKLAQEGLWLTLYHGLRELEKPIEAADVLREGIDKGVAKGTRQRFLQIGEAYYDGQNLEQALAFFARAAEVSPDDGTADLYVGQVLLDQEKFAEARIALQKAIAKGNLRQPGNAYYQLGITEQETGNDQAAIAAFQQAKTYPESERNATQALKSMGR